MAEQVLEGKVAVITGGGRGLGREMAIAFAEAGAAGVTVTAAPGSDETAEEIEAELHQTLAAIHEAGGIGLGCLAEVADEFDCQRVMAETLDAFGGLDILVNNAAKAGRYAHHGDAKMAIFEADPDGFREMIDTNILGPFLMAHAAAGPMVEEGWGRIINISKRVDSMHRSAITPYGPSKAALDAATIAWAEAFHGSGVTVNSLSPGGAVDTKFGTGEVTGRGLDPAVIRPMAVWLASPASDGVSGCRYTAEFWDASLPPDAAAEACREPAIFPVPARDTPIKGAWDPRRN
jgi:NAD(P)-dependent dehydrogenase (short-subunit alcohol dehydrogenase family)